MLKFTKEEISNIKMKEQLMKLGYYMVVPAFTADLRILAKQVPPGQTAEEFITEKLTKAMKPYGLTFLTYTAKSELDQVEKHFPDLNNLEL